jgi:hypothetical protein
MHLCVHKMLSEYVSNINTYFYELVANDLA